MDEKDKLDDQQIESQELEQSASQEEQETDTQEQEQVQEEEQEEPQVEEEGGGEAPEEEQKPPSRRENLRIQQLLAKLNAQKQEARQQQQDQGLDYRQTLEADDEVYKQLESDRQQYGDTRYNQGLEQAKSIQFHTRLEIDAPKVVSKYPQFNPESPEFNPVAANAINEWYLQTVGYDPKTDRVGNASVRYAEYVDSVMELATELAGQKVETSRKNIARQAASTGLRPDGSSAKRLNLNQAPEAMSDEELEAVIASALPKK